MISDTKQEPTIDYCREMLVHVQRFWDKQITFDKLRSTMYWDEDQVPQEDTAAKGRRRRIQPERMTANELRREVDLITSLFPYPAEIGVQYIGEGSKSESVSEQVELGLNEAIDQLNPPLDSPLLRERSQMCLLGRSARLTAPGQMHWWDFPYLESGETLDQWNKRHNQWATQAPIPVCWVDLPAESTFPSSFGRIDEELISWQTVTGYDLYSMFSPDELTPIYGNGQANLGDEFTLVIFSNQAWLAYGLVGGASIGQIDTSPLGMQYMLRTMEHNLGVPAIQIVPGVTSHRKEPGRFWVGIADSSISLIKAANRRLSEAATASKFDSLPIFKMWLQDSNLLEEGDNADTTSMFQGDLWQLRAGGTEGMEKEDITALFNPQFGEKTLALAQFALARSERNSGAVEALEGATGPSGEPAWSRNSIIEQSKMKQSRLSQAVAASDLSAAEMISRSIISFGEDVPLTNTGKGPQIVLKPDQLKSYRVVLKSEYKMQLPVSRRADIQLMVSTMEQIKMAGLPLSPAWVMENVGDISRPLEEFKRSLTWELLMSDESKAFYKQLLVKESELDLAQEEGMGLGELQQLVASGQLPPQIAQQFAQLVSTPKGGSFRAQQTVPNCAPQASKMARAGLPFSTSPTGPQPEQAVQPQGAGPY